MIILDTSFHITFDASEIACADCRNRQRYKEWWLSDFDGRDSLKGYTYTSFISHYNYYQKRNCVLFLRLAVSSDRILNADSFVSSR